MEEDFDSMPKFKSAKYLDIEEYIVGEAVLPTECDKPGRAVMSFVVKKDGSVTDIKPVYFDHPAMVAVAVKMLEATDKCWEPAKKGPKRTADATLEAVIPFGSDIQLSFMGRGSETYTIYVKKAIKYPKSVHKLGLGTIKILVKFIVDENGYPTNIKVERAQHEDIVKEVIRVVENSPRWYPVRKDGEFRKFSLIIPIIFRLI